MEIHLNRLEAGPVHLEFDAPVSRLEDRVTGGPIQIKAHLARDQDRIRLTGDYRAEVMGHCDLCLGQIPLIMAGKLDLVLCSEDEDKPEQWDLELNLDAQDQDYYQGDKIEVQRYFQDQLILDLPPKLLCSPECRGLCARCGADLNHEPCRCDGIDPSNPFLLLKDLQEKHKKQEN